MHIHYIHLTTYSIVIIYRRAFLNKLATSSLESSPRLLMAWALIFPTSAGFITSLLPDWYFGGNPIICQHNINDRVVPRSSKNLRLETIFFWFWEAMFRKISFRLQISWSLWPTHFRFAQHQLYHLISCHWCSSRLSNTISSSLVLIVCFWWPFFFWVVDVVVSNIFYFYPYLGKWSNLTNIFQMGWNHQPCFFIFFQCCLLPSEPSSRPAPGLVVPAVMASQPFANWSPQIRISWGSPPHVGRAITRKRCRL